MSKNNWYIPNKDNLAAALRKINVTVPRRTNGRTKEHTERYAIARLLATIASRLDFPLEIIHDDRPDFILSSANSRIGIEHTELIPENVAAAAALRERGYGPRCYLLPRTLHGEKKKTAKELIDEINSNEQSSGWSGNAPERVTADAIVRNTLTKVASSKKVGYRLFDSNWLLMYNNWPAPDVNIRESACLAYLNMLDTGVFDTFDFVAILDSSNLTLISAAGVECLSLKTP